VVAIFIHFEEKIDRSQLFARCQFNRIYLFIAASQLQACSRQRRQRLPSRRRLLDWATCSLRVIHKHIPYSTSNFMTPLKGSGDILAKMQLFARCQFNRIYLFIAPGGCVMWCCWHCCSFVSYAKM